MPLTPASPLDFYEILAPLGARGMGEVYRAPDTALKRDVAIKVLPYCWSHDPERLHRFEVEAQAAALNHPNVVSIFHVGRYNGSPAAARRNSSQASAAQATPITRGARSCLCIAQGLAAACTAGIIHRNLKPEKHLSHQDGRVKILDFGLAKLDPSQTTIAEADTATLEQQTRPGQVLGTVGYISLEQIRGQAAGARSDIFALGRTRCLPAGAPSKSQPWLRR